MDYSLIYVSEKTLVAFDPDRAVQEIVATARSRNAASGITGALVCTSNHFAQILEGPHAEIDALMRSIEFDPRHANVVVLDTNPIAQRIFTNWTMAYSGTSTYVARQIEVLLLDFTPLSPARIDRLRRLIVGFAIGDVN